MDRGVPFARIAAAALLYGACVLLSVTLTRFNGGFAMFWLATAVIVPVALSEPRRRWLPLALACGLSNIAVTGWFGMGWVAAIPLALANLSEATIDVAAVGYATRRYRTFTALPWLGVVFIVGGIVAPLGSGLIAAATVTEIAARPFVPALLEWFAAHAMGFLTLFPLAGLIARSRFRKQPLVAERADRRRAIAVLVVLGVVGALVFGQGRVPLLFLPTLVLMFAMLLCDLVVAAIGVLLLLTIAAYFTFAGTGPLTFVSPDRARQFFFLQGYFACIALTALPIGIMIERRRRMFSRLAESEARYRALAEFSTDIILVTDRDGAIRFVSPSVDQIGDYAPAELVGTPAGRFIAEDYRAAVEAANFAVLANPGQSRSVEFLCITTDKHLRWFESHLRAIVRDDGTVDGVCSVIRDIAHRKRREDELRAVALTDPLTRLANRRAFEMFVGDGTAGGFVAMIDLDHFKRINDSFGHDCGDRVLKAFARAARAVLREDDVVARIGGEEFAVYLPGATLAQARLVCGRLTEALAAQAACEVPKGWRVTASVGLAPLDGALDAVLKAADTALYQAKAAGRDRLAIAA